MNDKQIETIAMVIDPEAFGIPRPSTYNKLSYRDVAITKANIIISMILKERGQ